MKRVLCILLALLLVCSLLAGCGSAQQTPETVEPEPPPKPELGLSVLFRGAPTYRPLTTYGTGAYYGYYGLYPFLWQLDFSDMTVKEVDDPLLTDITQHWFFTSEDYLYCMPGGDEGFAFWRSELDGTGRVDVVVPDTMLASYSVIAIGDRDGSLYYMFEENPRHLYPEGTAYSLHTGDSYLVKIDFENKKHEVVWQSELHTNLIGVCKDSFVISQNGTYKLLDIREGGEPKLFEGRAYEAFEVMQTYGIDYIYTDPYTNTAFAQSWSHGYTVVVIDLNEGTQTEIVFDSQMLEDYKGTVGGSLLRPRAFTRDGVIVTLDHIMLKDMGAGYSVFGYISREDYMRGDYNVVPFDYSAVAEDLN